MNRFWQFDNGLIWLKKNMPEKRIVIDVQKDLFYCAKKIVKEFMLCLMLSLKFIDSILVPVIHVAQTVWEN